MKSLYTKKLQRILLISAISFSSLQSFAQDVMLQGWYWDYPKTANGYCWADTLKNKAAALGSAGFTYIWVPPLSRSSSGSSSNGYNPKDLYDYGEYGGGATGFGTRAQVDAMVSNLNSAGVKLVGDLVYNHRDGGKFEVNPGVKSYMENYTSAKVSGGANPFPYDRMRCILPLGGSTGNTAGDYFFKIRSASQHSRFYGLKYRIYLNTNKKSTWGGQSAIAETEPNGGSDCSQANNTIELVRDIDGVVDNSGCGIDEFKLTITSADYNASGDTLYIWFNDMNNGNYPDSRIVGLWAGPRSADIAGEVKYQTYTDFKSMPSGKGQMDWSNFKPNLTNSTYLEGNWDAMYFYYDYDQFVPDTKTKLYDWTRWNWSDIGMRGIRLDAVKHFSPEFVGDLLDNMHDNGMDPGVVVGEWYSDNTAELAGWVNNVKSYMNESTKSAIYPRIFDFSLREALRNACDTYGYDVRNVFYSSIVDAQSSMSGQNVITFLNNHDFRQTSGFNSLIRNDAILGYVYLITNNKVGLPSVFYPDYYGYPNDGQTYYPSSKAALKSKMDPLIKLRREMIPGSSVTYLNKSGSGYSNDASANGSLLVYQLSGGSGGKEIVVAINFSGSEAKFHQQLKGLSVGTKLTDYLGTTPAAEVTVQASENGIPNDIYMQVPARGYAVWVQGGAAAPNAPSNLQITGSTTSSISLSWTDNSADETGFKLERKTGDAGTWGDLQTVAANTTNYTDNSIAACTNYFYRVSAVNGTLVSAASSEVKFTHTCPSAFAVSGGGSFCAGGAGVSVNLSGSETGVTYTLYKDGVAQTPTVAGTGSAISFTGIAEAGVYTVKGSRNSNTTDMTGSATVTVNAAPTAFSVSGGGSYCTGGTGVAVGLSGSESGVNYQLFIGGSASGTAIAGTGSAISFGSKTTEGTYTVVATHNSSSCTKTMTGSVTVTVKTLPATFAVSGGGSYCSGGAGVAVGLSGSETGVAYQLYLGTNTSGSPVNGTGSALDFGLKTLAGTYTVVATNTTTTCSQNMTGSATIAVSPAPTAFNVNGGGTLCAGGQGVNVGLSGSQTSVVYTLLINGNAQAATVTGSGSEITFGLQTTAGTYTVIANRGSNCELTMNGNAQITVNAAPAKYSITGGGSYCSGGNGVPVGLSGSETGVNYQLFLGTSPTGSPVAGTGSALDFGLKTTTGTYSITATHATSGCVTTMTGLTEVNVSPTPTSFHVNGGGSFCSGGQGVTIGLDGSQSSVTYTLLANNIPLTPTVVGTGSAITFGNQIIAGTYTVIANRGSSCELTMSGSANIIVNTLPATPVITTNNKDSLFSSAVSGNQWYLNGVVLPGATSQKIKATESGNYTVVVTEGDCSSVVSNTINLVLVGLKTQIQTVAMSIYPNPSNGQFKVAVSTPATAECAIGVFNSLGARVWSKENVAVNGDFSTEINLKGSPPGVYVVMLRSSNGSISKRLIIK